MGTWQEDAAIAGLLRPLGYAGGQFGGPALALATRFIGARARAGKPFFCWFNATLGDCLHVRDFGNGPPVPAALTGPEDGGAGHDGQIGHLLKLLDDLGIANDTIVLYTAASGGHVESSPEMTPFLNPEITAWEGAFRAPCIIRWPGKIGGGQVSNAIISGLDWLPTLLAAAGEPDIKQKLLTGHTLAGKTFKAHLDGCNQLPYLLGQLQRSKRKVFFYCTGEAGLLSMRYENWQIFFEDHSPQVTNGIRGGSFPKLHLPKLFDLRADPYNSAGLTSNGYYDWFISQPYLAFAAQTAATKFLEFLSCLPAEGGRGGLQR